MCQYSANQGSCVSFNEMLHDLVLGVSKQGAFQTGVFGHVNCFRFLNHLHPKN